MKELKTIKVKYRNGNTIILKNINDYSIADGNIYVSEYDWLKMANQWSVVPLKHIESITDKCDEMPFDKDGRHATGYQTYIVDDNRWYDEYEEEE